MSFFVVTNNNSTTTPTPSKSINSIEEDEQTLLIAKTASEESQQSKKPLLISILTVLISIPALVGSFGSILGLVVSGAAVTFAHAITFAITLAILTNLSQYHFWKCQTRTSDRGHFYKFGPFYLTAIAVPLCVFDVFRHLLVDNQIWTIHSFISPAAYRPGCNEENIKCLSVMGVFSAIIFTYTGYILLLTGTVWCADLHTKIRKAWRKLRPSK
ncbi:hypothetical protein CYY_007851 [Polysphondylium violaceum]|uniref:Transmembrane protein n=1 Tax=Polysphondylium violaceum TaxID=133409 RepID=A0A8J4PN08_9MYCE|nr:hypothetical protein CYY_007851 [Polysphondylium violaceum]